MSLIMDAIQYATQAHAGVARKYHNDPYIWHPARVAGLVASCGGTESMIAAAWLHDVIEDCGKNVDELAQLFGPAVAGLVLELTDPEEPGVPRGLRKKNQRDRLRTASRAAKLIKLCDRLDNVRDMHGCGDPRYIKLYADETRLLLDAIGDVEPIVSAAILCEIVTLYANTERNT